MWRAPWPPAAGLKQHPLGCPCLCVPAPLGDDRRLAASSTSSPRSTGRTSTWCWSAWTATCAPTSTTTRRRPASHASRCVAVAACRALCARPAVCVCVAAVGRCLQLPPIPTRPCPAVPTDGAPTPTWAALLAVGGAPAAGGRAARTRQQRDAPRPQATERAGGRALGPDQNHGFWPGAGVPPVRPRLLGEGRFCARRLGGCHTAAAMCRERLGSWDASLLGLACSTTQQLLSGPTAYCRKWTHTALPLRATVGSGAELVLLCACGMQVVTLY